MLVNIAYSDFVCTIDRGLIDVRIEQGTYFPASYHLSPDSKYGYINIAKNASLTLESIVQDANWIRTREKRADEYFVILRDPIDRWLSGIPQFIMETYGVCHADLQTHITELLGALDLKSVQDLILTVKGDEHIVPQCYFLQGFELSKVKFFYYDKQVVENVCLFANLPNTSLRLNETDKWPIKHQLYQKIKSIYQNSPALQERLNTYYKCDYFLLNYLESNNIKFQNR